MEFISIGKVKHITIQSYMEHFGDVRNSFSLESLEIWVPVQAVQLSDQREYVFLSGKYS